MQFYSIFRLIVSLGTLVVGAKQRSDKWNINYCPTGRGIKILELNIQCPNQRYVLSDIKILAGRKMNKCGRTAYGRTPDLITALNNCYWQTSCVIKFPMMRMVSCVDTVEDTDQQTPENIDHLAGVDQDNSAGVDNAQCNCYWEEVEFLRPVSAECIKKKEITTICSSNKPPKKKGLIKSHDIIPWNYGKRLPNQTCSTSLSMGKKKLAISVKYAELYDEDTLMMETVNKRNNQIIDRIDLGNLTNTNEVIEVSADQYAKFDFTVSEDTRGSGGFIICYKGVKKKTKNVCPKTKQPKLKVKSQLDTCYQG